MKKFRYILLALVVALTSIGAEAKKVFAEASKIDGVISCYIGKAMLRLAGSDLGETISGVDFPEKLLRQLDSLEMIVANDGTASQVSKLCDNAIIPLNLDVMAEINNDMHNVVISSDLDDNFTRAENLCIKVLNGNQAVYVLMSGDMTYDAIQELIGDRF